MNVDFKMASVWKYYAIPYQGHNPFYQSQKYKSKMNKLSIINLIMIGLIAT